MSTNSRSDLQKLAEDAQSVAENEPGLKTMDNGALIAPVLSHRYTEKDTAAERLGLNHPKSPEY